MPLTIRMTLLRRGKDGRSYQTKTTISPWVDIEGAELLKALWDIELAINDHTDTRCHIEVGEE